MVSSFGDLGTVSNLCATIFLGKPAGEFIADIGGDVVTLQVRISNTIRNSYRFFIVSKLAAVGVEGYSISFSFPLSIKRLISRISNTLVSNFVYFGTVRISKPPLKLIPILLRRRQSPNRRASGERCLLRGYSAAVGVEGYFVGPAGVDNEILFALNSVTCLYFFIGYTIGVCRGHRFVLRTLVPPGEGIFIIGAG